MKGIIAGLFAVAAAMVLPAPAAAQLRPVAAAISLPSPASPRPRRVGASDRPITEAWPVVRSWDGPAEAEYGRWVQTIGRAVEARRCRTLADCLDRADLNPLAVPGRRSTFRADCADVPYILRAFFAWRRKLPFVHTSSLRAERPARDGRYAFTNRPTSTRRWTDYATPRRLLHDLGSTVHSGYFRMRPELDDSDTYPVRVDREAIRPGTAFYDPDGHVLVVYEVRADGEVRLIDGHPGGSFTARRFSAQLTLGSSWQGGGFRNFRPVYLRDGVVSRPANRELADFDPMVQHDPARWVVGGRALGYHDWVRTRLGAPLPPAP
ncbi:MAG: hypothetical protein JWM10_1300 [Myxococcaceae bacterium]|nr:hypothetical protein [Myxococcaceae bacterium]